MCFSCGASILAVGETMLFHATVEEPPETALKRRTSRLLLPLPVSQRKPKVRELALTSHRLVCLKPLKSGRGVGIKAEFALGKAHAHGPPLAGSGREKRAKGDEDRGTVTGVERKGIKEFVVLSTAKSGFFVTESEAAADAWVQRIAGALRQPNGVKPERKLSSAVANPWSDNHTTGNSSNNNNNNINHNISCART